METNTVSTHYIECLTSGREDGITLSIRWNNARLIVDLDPSPTGNAKEDSLVEKYNAAVDAGDEDEEEAVSDQILDAIVEVGRSIFDHLAPPDISFSVGGQEMCAKVGDELMSDSAQRELSCLWKATNSQHASALRVPKLLGLVRMPDSDKIVGILEEYIPFSNNWELSTLRNIENVSTITRVRRQKWASQIEETIHLLHQIGVTWGDGKASNVLIHRDTDDAWVIDFGGGWTDGWVSQELSGTVEGDEMALKRIFEYLEI
ncbi:hypothetical protein F4820DRAFT_408951 [Hypoxylon rubiginosum]|uniref:Uncharacterized protein n=1 Tax=Hypoxylon rubiginosum TaxID=110542 RepID=A0ACB9ZBF8_9PEZI|nr:hypothetical protein F4820DRAFT_408951 [Hypoxylon rubiginosum]